MLTGATNDTPKGLTISEYIDLNLHKYNKLLRNILVVVVVIVYTRFFVVGYYLYLLLSISAEFAAERLS